MTKNKKPETKQQKKNRRKKLLNRQRLIRKSNREQPALATLADVWPEQCK